MASISCYSAISAVRNHKDCNDTFIPYLICKFGKKAYTKKGALQILLFGILAAAGVFVLTENLSTAIIVFGIRLLFFFVAYPRTRKIGIVFVCLVVGGLIAGQILGSFWSPAGTSVYRESSPGWTRKIRQKRSFQTMQGLLAIGSGGFSERDWGQRSEDGDPGAAE